IRYTAWSVFRARTDTERLPEGDRAAVAEEAEGLLDQLAAKDVVVRGVYDVAALRADADLMVWWHAPTAEDLQEAYRGCAAAGWAGRWSRCGRCSRCTGRRSSTRATCRR